jgi:hypothetical protein
VVRSLLLLQLRATVHGPFRRIGRSPIWSLLGAKLPRQPGTGKVAIDPSVWTGRALQAENDDLGKVGLAHLYPAY